MTITFEEAKTALTKLGVEYGLACEYRGTPGVDRKSYDLPLFTTVTLPLRPTEWMQLVRSDGAYYIGGCCASSSAMQDMVCHWFRFADAGVSVRDLAKVAAGQVEHDGDDSPFFAIANLLAMLMGREDWERPEGQVIDPWWLMAAVWHLVKGHYAEERPHAVADHVSPVEKSLHIVEHACRAISWERLFSKGDGALRAPESQERAARAMLLARFLPAIKTLFERATDLYSGPVNGFAIIDSGQGPKALARNGHGYCIYSTAAEVDELFASWDKQDALYEDERARKPVTPSRERFAVRPVRVDLNGLVFTDTNELYEGTNA